MNYKETFPARLKEAREQKGITQKEMAIALNIARPSYVNYERGKTYPTFENLMKISEELNISIDYLCGINDYSRIIKNNVEYNFGTVNQN